MSSMLLTFVGVSEAQVADQCFDAGVGPWEPVVGTFAGTGEPNGPPDVAGDSMFYAFPPRILLTGDSPPRGSRPGVYRLDVPANSLQVPKPFRYWSHEGDSLSLGLGDGFTSVSAVLRRADDQWVGVLRNRSDNLGTQLYMRPLQLREVDCSSEPPIPASVDLPVPRAVPSESGPQLELGSPVPSQYEAIPVRSFALIRGMVLPEPWAGADSVLVRTNVDGLISEIEVRYYGEFDASPLRAALIEQFGSGQPDSPWLSWWNRTTRSLLQVGRITRVMLIDPRLRY